MISVIIPLYNKANTVCDSVRSVISQSYKDLELIVVDDGSSDEGVHIVEDFDDPRIMIIRQKNMGPSSARNNGLKHSHGEWIVFLDADDELTSGALTLMMENIGKYPDADIIDFNRYLKSNGTLSLQRHPLTGKVKNPLRSWYFGDIVPGCGHSIFKSAFIRKYPYNENFRRYEDAEILFRILPEAKVYSSCEPTEIHSTDFAEASRPLSSIEQDFIGHLSFDNDSFWHRMNMYRYFIYERNHYKKECRRLYPSLYKRADLFCLFRFLPLIKSFLV